MKDRQFAEFLRSRRARLRPEDVGVPGTGRRRVAGLRRDETAMLAGVSVEYYTRLEQGRGGQPSDEVLDGLARALQLDAAARGHLFNLAHPERSSCPSPAGNLRTEVATLVTGMPHTPVTATGPRLDVLARNRLAVAVFGDPRDPWAEPGNCARNMFLNPAQRELYVDWHQEAAEVVALLRRQTGQFPADSGLRVLIEELSLRSDAFRRMWADHNVRQKLHGHKRMRHPLVGELTLSYETLLLPDDHGVAVTFYTAEPGSPAQAAMERLAARLIPTA